MPEYPRQATSHLATPLASQRERLVQARYQREWSQQELADLLGTTPLNVSRWERGLTSPNPYFRQKLCSLFGLSEIELACVLILLLRERQLLSTLLPLSYSSTPLSLCRQPSHWSGELLSWPRSRAS